MGISHRPLAVEKNAVCTGSNPSLRAVSRLTAEAFAPVSQIASHTTFLPGFLDTIEETVSSVRMTSVPEGNVFVNELISRLYANQVGDIDILKVVHHGTANGTTSEFLNVVDPEVAIICNGNYLGNKHGHPHPTAIKNLYNYDNSILVYCITGGGTIDGVANKANNTYKCSSEDRFYDRNGLIILTIDNNGYSLTSEYFGSDLKELKDTKYYLGILENNLD